jgi:hypothetical protein
MVFMPPRMPPAISFGPSKIALAGFGLPGRGWGIRPLKKLSAEFQALARQSPQLSGFHEQSLPDGSANRSGSSAAYAYRSSVCGDDR